MRGPGTTLLTFRFFFALFLIAVSAGKFLLSAQYTLEPFVGSASRLHSVLISNLPEAYTLERELPGLLTAASVSGLLEYTGAVGAGIRGSEEVRSDVGIGGASFEQVPVMVDGDRINDAQTGHHNRDFPVFSGRALPSL